MIEPYKNKALGRLKRARGQIDGIIKMIEDEKPCGDILTQILALNGAVKGIAPFVVESHLHTCGEKNLASKDSEKREKFIKEIVRACELSSR
ncbi:metal-sensitive transcriptional regulator [Candidatus Peregrinibacteria bacterium]|jgi:CsoR family transcriptional regulator, copper-sensing transcriptional repressor|nr:metal-sensitive transcriptional regulator [Candidatus Peregrinibacteria bacterium]